jgi:ATP-dependent protease Clp ATPase subunit
MYVRSNPCIIGPTGSGKTLAVQSGANLVGFPYVEFKMGQVTPLPIVGNVKLPLCLEMLIDNVTVSQADVKRHLGTLVKQNRIDNDTAVALNSLDDMRDDPDSYSLADQATRIYMAERGIIFMDEVDKVAYRGKPGELGTKESVQNELLDYLGGDEVVFDERSGVSPGLHTRVVNTSHILFFLAGAFSDLDAVTNGEDITSDDLISYGLKPELLGRTGVPIVFEQLDRDDLTRIFKEAWVFPTTSTMEELLIADLKNDFPGVELSDDAIKYLVEKAEESKLGARYLAHEAATLSSKLLFRLLYQVGLEKREEKLVINRRILEKIV